MLLAIERVMIFDFLIDTMLLAAVLRPYRIIRLGRLVCAGILGALVSGFIAVSDLPRLIKLSVAIILPFAMIHMVTELSFADTVRLGCRFLACSALTAAIAKPLIDHIPLAMAGLIGVLAAAMINRQGKITAINGCINVEIAAGGTQVRFRAFIDTGNKLHEPISSLPVMIVDADLVADLLPAGFEPDRCAETLPRGFRLASYGGIGGTGCMGCFLPDRMVISGSGRSAQKTGAVWIGVYPEKLPGAYRALASSEIIM